MAINRETTNASNNEYAPGRGAFTVYEEPSFEIGKKGFSLLLYTSYIMNSGWLSPCSLRPVAESQETGICIPSERRCPALQTALPARPSQP